MRRPLSPGNHTGNHIGKVLASSVLSCAITVFSMGASAAEFTRTITIQRVAGVSTSRPGYPAAQSVFRIYAAVSAPWGSSTCRSDAADISLDDWHIYPIVMRAWKENISVSVVVESTERIDGTDTVCKVVAIQAPG